MQVSGDIVRLGVAIKTAERNANKCRDKITAMETEQTEADAEKKVTVLLYLLSYRHSPLDPNRRQFISAQVLSGS